MIQKYNLAQELITEIESKIERNEVYLKEEIDKLLEKYYTKTEIDQMFAQGGTPPQGGGGDNTPNGEYYTKTEIDQLLQTVKNELNTSLDDKANVDEVYTKQEIDDKFNDLGNGGGGGAPVDAYTKVEVDNKLGEKANTTDVYTKQEIDDKFNDLGDGGGIPVDAYTKQEVDTKLGEKANTTDVYTKHEVYQKTEVYNKEEIEEKLQGLGNGGGGGVIPVDAYTKAEVDNKLDLKADTADVYAKTEVYTKQEIDEKFSDLGPGDGGGAPVDAYTKVEVDTKLDLKADKDGVYSKEEVDQKIADLGAPGSSGDMTKDVYDTNNNGIVDKAETLDGLTTTVEQLNHIDGVTSNIQEQLNDRYNKSEIDTLIAQGTGHTHDNKEILDKFSISKEGNLQFNDRPIEGGGNVDVDLSPYMEADKFASTVNDGNVKKADYAEKITGEDKLQPLMYRGTNAAGELGYHYLPIEEDVKGELDQRVILNAEQNKVYNIGMASEINDGKAIIQAYKFVEGEQDIISTVKTFNNGDQENFYYDKENIVFDNGCSIATEHKITTSQESDYYITSPIKKSDFVTSIIIRGVE